MDYLYDVNGNLIQDANKGLTAAYDHQNLPEKVDFGAGREILFLYDGTGQKLRKVVKEAGQPDQVRDYAAGFVYQNGAWEFFSTTEGRVVKDASSGNDFRYEYHFTDHLGNTRLAYADLDQNGVVEAASEVLQEDHFYPYGLSLVGVGPALTGVEELRKFNGKELNREFGLEWSDFGARHYDQQTGRWVQVDPLAEKRLVLSGYNFASLNPILRLDPDGRLDTTYTFNAQGELLSVDHLDEEGVKLLIKSQFGEAETSAFNDPADKGKLSDMNKGDLLHIMTGENAGWFLKQSGIEPGNFHIFLPGMKTIDFIAASHGPFDYAGSYLFKGVGDRGSMISEVWEAENAATLFLMPDGKIYNMMDTGNWLWGATAYKIGYPEMVAKLGAHLNELLSPSHDPNSTHYFDTEEDQRAISSGYNYASKEYNLNFYINKAPRKPFWMGSHTQPVPR